MVPIHGASHRKPLVRTTIMLAAAAVIGFIGICYGIGLMIAMYEATQAADIGDVALAAIGFGAMFGFVIVVVLGGALLAVWAVTRLLDRL